MTVTADAAQQPPDNQGEVIQPNPQPGVTTVFVTGSPSPAPPPPDRFTTAYGSITVRCRNGNPVVSAVDPAPGYVDLGPVPSLFSGDVRWVFFIGESGTPWYRISVRCDGDQPVARLVKLPYL